MRDFEEEIILTKALIVALDTGENTDFEHSVEELKSLAEAAGKQVVGVITQRMPAANKAYYIGAGKVSEVKAYAAATEAEEIIFDDSLTPSQIRNLGNELELPVMDRTNLILDIFALRAKTGEAKLQVETARLQYMLPRLVGMRENLSRQGGTGGSMSNKGAGETKLELDRRKIEHRISELGRELKEIAENRTTQRAQRERSGIPEVVLVGYTNAGKSTILNKLVEKYGENKEKTVLEKDMLFATLDTRVRTIKTGDNKPFFLADTVGFIDKLPHNLVKAFRSTLEEVKYADLLVQVVDYSDPHFKQHMEVTAETLRELGGEAIPQLIVYNKSDRCEVSPLPKLGNDCIYMAAAPEIGLEELILLIKDRIYAQYREATFLVPYDQGRVTSYLQENATVYATEYLPEGVRLRVHCSGKDVNRYREYLLE